MDRIPPVPLSPLDGDTLAVGGRTYRLAPMTVADTAALQAWVKDQLDDPIAVARELARDQPEGIATNLLMDAYNDVRNGARRLGSPEATRVLNTDAGVREMFYLRGRLHQPGMTRDDWGRVLLEKVAEVAAADETSRLVTLAERLGKLLHEYAGPAMSADECHRAASDAIVAVMGDGGGGSNGDPDALAEIRDPLSESNGGALPDPKASS